MKNTLLGREELTRKYDAYYKAKPDKWSSDQRNGFAFESLKDMGVEQKVNPMRILDIGCGNGHTLKYFYDRFPIAKYAGLDLSPEACRLAKEKMPMADIRCGFLGDVTFDTLFDIILLLGVAEHFEDLQVELPKIRNLLAKNGLVYIEVPNCIAYPQSEHVQGFRELATGNHQYEWHLYRPTWEQILVEAGFEIVKSLQGPTIQTEFVWVLR